MLATPNYSNISHACDFHYPFSARWAPPQNRLTLFRSLYASSLNLLIVCCILYKCTRECEHWWAAASYRYFPRWMDGCIWVPFEYTRMCIFIYIFCMPVLKRIGAISDEAIKDASIYRRMCGMQHTHVHSLTYPYMNKI